ncbi:MAG: D-alanyl-D-alanine carboxypeptidase, partial [Clostridia bacterium]|nr:D-alanyl-D-alanine carboxypeptidase [Clostridia bacterium]
MKNKKKKMNALLAAVAIFTSFGVASSKQAAQFHGDLLQNCVISSAKTVKKEVNGIQTHAKGAYVMESSSGTEIYSKDAEKRLPIASMCKIMTLLLCFDDINAGRLSLEESVIASERAASMGGSQVYLDANGEYKVQELLKSIVVCSANDSCVAMAERVCGSESAFVDKMNEKAANLGMNNTLFSNCTGLPKDPQYSCAKDVAKMLSELVKNKEYLTYSRIWMEDFTHPSGRVTGMTNTNTLVRFYEGCDGGKTGFTSQAGFCLAAT